MTRSAPSSLARFAWLSIGAAIATIALKTLAWRMTGSVGLLSDALESIVNLAAAVMTLVMVTIAARPPDEDHAYGHGKAEYFASGLEGALILVAAGGIIWTAAHRLVHPRALERLGLGLAVSVGASLVNLAVARVLIRTGKGRHSIALEADGHHLMTDVWTSAGVLVGIGAVGITGWTRLDPLVAIAVALNIVWTGVTLVRRSALGLLDTGLAAAERRALEEVLARHAAEHLQFHALRTRQAGSRRFVSVHVLVPGAWTVQRGHALLEEIERDLRAAIPNLTVTTHLEPIEDSVSFEDQELDRSAPPAIQDPAGQGR
ncbi:MULTISPECIES: cation diffusion facilitator family transporter [unclassified Anaeromyxobacter]|uniref:cation diffusion facilitator family transporter n=1 Tax=unclassified Anaeromyxobacter TaxID=2620896 RepID=UPI001F58028E|nr:MULTISPECIES: cation diffusion facilitator family transporter [unclassified Anaeromyxobacter]